MSILEDADLLQTSVQRIKKYMEQDGKYNALHPENKQYMKIKDAEVALIVFKRYIEERDVLHTPSGLLSKEQCHTLKNVPLDFDEFCQVYVDYFTKLPYLFRTIGADREAKGCLLAIEKITA